MNIDNVQVLPLLGELWRGSHFNLYQNSSIRRQQNLHCLISLRDPMLLEPFWHMKPFVQYRSDIFLEREMLQKWKYNRHELKCLIQGKISIILASWSSDPWRIGAHHQLPDHQNVVQLKMEHKVFRSKGWRMKLNGLLSTITILQKSFDTQERSFTCSNTPVMEENATDAVVISAKRQEHSCNM